MGKCFRDTGGMRKQHTNTRLATQLYTYIIYLTSIETPLYSILPLQYDALFLNLPAIALSKLVLPQPGGPMTKYVLPGFNTRLTSLSIHFFS